MMIAELGSTEVGGAKSAWVDDALTTQLSTNYSRIKGEFFAAVSRACGEEKIGEKGLRGARRYSEGCAIAAHVKLPEQPHCEHWIASA